MDKTLPGPYAKYLPLLAPLMYFTKFIGVTVCVAVVFVLLLRIKSEVEERIPYAKRLLYFLLVGVFPFVVWFLRNSFYARGVSTYQSIMFQADYYDASLGHAGIGAIFARALENFYMYISQVSQVFITYKDLRSALPPSVLNVLIAVILALMLIGFIRELILKRGLKDFYFLSYFSILIVWPTYGYGDANRYLLPLIPLLYYYFFKGFELITSPGAFFNRGEAASASGGASRRALLLLFPVCIFIIFNLAQIKSRVFSPAVFGRLARSSSILGDNLFKRIDSVEVDSASTPNFKRNVPCYHHYLKSAKLLTLASGPNDIIMTRKPELIALISGRKVIRFPYSSDERVIFGFIEENKVTHILLDGCYKETEKYILPITNKYEEKFMAWVAADGSHSGILKMNK
jgi:hypothetical protein